MSTITKTKAAAPKVDIWKLTMTAMLSAIAFILMFLDLLIFITNNDSFFYLNVH